MNDASDSLPRIAYFEEDDYCQIQLLPAAIRPFVQEELAKVAAFYETHRQPNGTFDDLYVRAVPPKDLTDLHITPSAVTLSLWPHLKKYDEVHVGWPGEGQCCPDLLAWGDDEDVAIFAVTEGDVVSALFLSRGWSERGATLMAEALPELPDADRMLLVDWDHLVMHDVARTHDLRDYLMARAMS